MTWDGSISQEPKEDAAPEPEDGKVKRRKGKLVPSPYKAGWVKTWGKNLFTLPSPKRLGGEFEPKISGGS